MLKKTILASLISAASFSAMAIDYFVVVPVPGRIAMTANINLALNVAALPSAKVNTPYTGFDFSTLLSVTGDPAFTSAGVQWSLVSGALPQGLVLNADGTLSGTPLAVGTQTFSLRATYKTKSGEQAYQVITGSLSATWNEADKGSGVMLNEDTATTPGSAMVRGTVGKSSGKWYWETKATVSAGGWPMVGVANSSANLNGNLGSNANSYGLMAAPPNPFGYVCFNGCGSNSAARYDIGDVIGFALDMDNRTLRVYRNGALVLTATSLPSGALYPAVGSGFPITYVANFGSQGFWQTPPTGYNALQ